MSEKENSGKKWDGCFGISLGFFGILLVFYVLYLYYLSINSWQEAILFFSSLLILIVVSYYYVVIITFSHSIPQFLNKIESQCCFLVVYETIALLLILFISIDNKFEIKLSNKNSSLLLVVLVILGLILIILIFLALFASTKFFYTESECWLKRVWINLKEWILNDNSFNKLLLWSAIFLILLGLILAIVVILCSNSSNKSWCEFLVNLITNKDLFEWTFNLFLFTFFALIISVIGQFLSKDKSKVTENKNISKEVHKDKVDENPKTDGGKDSEFLFYMLSVKVLIVWALVLIVAYSLTRTYYINNNSILAVSIYYAIFITIFYYFLRKFFEVINFAMPVHRLHMKIKVLSRSPLNKNTLRLWNAFWINEEFDNFWEEAAFLDYFVPKIIRHIKFFQLKERASVVADALHNFSDNIDKRYSEALAREVLNIVPRQYIERSRLPEYLVEVLNAYKDIVCNDKLVCEDLDSSTFLYKQSFGDKADEYMSKYKYQYLDELIYQILVTLRKSIEKLRNDGYFKKHDESRKILWEKFNKFVDTLGNLECVSNKGKKRLRDALKTESAKKWIKEAGDLLEEVADNNKDINVNNNCSTLCANFTKTVQALKEGKIYTDTLKKISKEWTEICKQDSAKQDNPTQS